MNRLNLIYKIETENSELSDDSTECICKTGFALDDGKCVEAPISITDLSCTHFGIQCGKVQNYVTMRNLIFNFQGVGVRYCLGCRIFFENFDFKTGRKNEFQGSNDKSCS